MDLHALSGKTGCLSKAGLSLATDKNDIQIAAPNGAGVDFMINGIMYHKADTDNIVMTALTAQAADTTCLYLVQLDSDGTLSVKKGTEQLSADIGDNLAVQWPAPDADNCPIGGYKVSTTSVTFTNGTTDLDASGVETDFFDFALGLPEKPETSEAVA